MLTDLLADGPTVMIVEDAHWADGATLDVLRHFSKRMPELPALLVVTYRENDLGRDHPLRSVLGVHRRTLQRWRHWWRTVFAATPFWSVTRGNLMPPPDATTLPASLLERFAGPDAPMRLVQCLQFLIPLHSPYE